MGRHALSRPPGQIALQAPPPHDQWKRGLLSGTLTLALETPPGQFVSPGTGRLGLTEMESKEIVAQRAARAGKTPVLPGSGIKGAVRTLYELLSFSCNPFERSGPCSARQCCDACSLFGRLGYAGRVGFSDAVPAGKGAKVEVRKVPVPFEGHGHRTPGDFRVYDFQEDTVPGSRDKRTKDMAREVYTGAFDTRMTFRNLTPEELGRLLLAMGLGGDEKTRFLLRLGGVKYDGQGAIKVTPVSLGLVFPKRRTLKQDDCTRECGEWIQSARTSSWAQTFWPKLEEAANVLQPGS
ncbi:MAG TPA: RAMP superfamily CRISPR-associated protein [Thermoanaerobaculia bacterium]|nr:RAMP superfamily CRISPR-associated protein [Thermoanaerobaculia bacterium]